MTISFNWQKSVGLITGVIADQIFADPQSKWHPVAVFGRFSSWVEKYSWRNSVLAGGVHVGLSVGPLIGLSVLVNRLVKNKIIFTALTTWAVLGAKTLAKEGRIMADKIDSQSLEQARTQLSHLCGRDPENLDESELARATVESLAENTADSAVASLFWGVVAGVPGMVFHRGINTLDAMIGYRNERYENFGKIAAKADDYADWIPARITGMLACLLARTVGGKPLEALKIMFRDAKKHPSPNGGWCEAGFAGALNVQLGGQNVYPLGKIENRGLLGDGPRPTAKEIRLAAKLVTEIVLLAAGVAAVISLVKP